MKSNYRLKLLTFVVAGLFVSACNLFTEPTNATGLGELKFTGTNLSVSTGKNGEEVLRGSGEVMHDKVLKSETSIARINLRATFDDRDSEITIYSHSKTDRSAAYELKLARVGNTLRLSTALDDENPRYVGTVFTGIEDWSVPREVLIEVNNATGRPSIKIWGMGNGANENTTPTLTEERTEAYPAGDRVAADLEKVSIYKFIVSERN